VADIGEQALAPKEYGMNVLANGLTTLFNGLFYLIGSLVSPVMLAVLVAGASLSWLALLECDDLDRRGTKPLVGTH